MGPTGRPQRHLQSDHIDPCCPVGARGVTLSVLHTDTGTVELQDQHNEVTMAMTGSFSQANENLAVWQMG
ncbi:hypothetical protein XELAEV_18001859mg [Xenopus laevis]|nr:hypothetical protein XELAEV_18001859mg [Xenopus laevis]